MHWGCCSIWITLAERIRNFICHFTMMFIILLTYFTLLPDKQSAMFVLTMLKYLSRVVLLYLWHLVDPESRLNSNHISICYFYVFVRWSFSANASYAFNSRQFRQNDKIGVLYGLLFKGLLRTKLPLYKHEDYQHKNGRW